MTTIDAIRGPRGLALIGIAIAALVGATLLASAGESGGAKKKKKSTTLTFAAPTFTPNEESTHNDGDPVCGAAVPTDPPAENQGDLNARKGSFLTNVQVPNRMKVKRLTLFANDNSAEDAHLYLVRKQIQDNLAPQFEGYEVMAKTNSSNAENNVMRKFSDTSISGKKVDNKHYSYFLELVVCDAIEPFAAQVTYRK